MISNRMEILVVDDEPKQRRGLAAMVRSLRPDYKVHEAKNGKEALELAETRVLDIVFTDIQMPLVNGIDFLKALNNQGSDMPKVVFVSVYHEFDYAQQALRLGAKDYLVKPVITEQLEPIICELEQQLLQESALQLEKKRLSDQLAHTKPVYLEHLLYKCLTEELHTAERSELRSHCALSGQGTVLILESKSDGRPQNDSEWKSILKRAVTQAFSSCADAVIVAPEHEKDRLYIMAAWKPETTGTACLEQLRKALNQLEMLYGRSISVGIGQETESIEADMRLCCDGAKHALQYLYYFPEGMWLSANELRSLQGKEHSSPLAAKDIDDMERAVAEIQTELAVSTLVSLLDRLAAGYPAPFRLQCSAAQLLSTCLKRAQLVIDEEGYRLLAGRIDQELLEAKSFKSMKEIAAQLLADMIKQMKKDKSSRSDLIMQKCREFVEDNLHEDLGLEMVATRFFYNPSYFSILFKNNVGVSFTDYLVKMRMQKARGLLLNSDLKVQEIARQSGYKDIKYFNKVFKKTFLYSPEEFRRMFSS
ncbi:two-component system response regulator YesN [Paenibacillus endophyticus]|uniref:Two-component system response regulator YesN n=1 Tax=Paenibacillus endophyticus TaxID=1294268 RepID=A0A7W5GCU7_9BACL|nr:response regulator [Paenibacillus endophyticus]MBB3154778.1 two-component system response regulator YesN [Paenibacillus endophyticus]